MIFAGVILRFFFCQYSQAGSSHSALKRPHEDFTSFQREDSRQIYKQLTPLSPPMYQSALARKSGGRGAARARIASDFLDFLVLFRQEKSTIKIQGNKHLEFACGSEQSRKIMKYYEKEGGNFVLKKTKYYILGNTEKEVNNVTGQTRTLNYIAGKAILEQTTSGDNLYYLHKDYQGTTMAITDETGNVVQRHAYDPCSMTPGFGECANPNPLVELIPTEERSRECWRRNPSTWSNLTASQIEQQNFLFARAYTGHEHLYDFGLINMNGRVYDPFVARFLSPDPIIQDTENSQNYNGYSYCNNNPLKYTDPSGYSFESIIKGFLNFVTMPARILSAGNAWVNDRLNGRSNPYGYYTLDYIVHGILPGPGNTFYLPNKGTDYSYRSWPAGVGGYIPGDGESQMGGGSRTPFSITIIVVKVQAKEQGDFNNMDISIGYNYKEWIETPGMNYNPLKDVDGDETQEEKKAQEDADEIQYYYRILFEIKMGIGLVNHGFKIGAGKDIGIIAEAYKMEGINRYYYDISASEFDLLSESVDIYYGGSVDLHAIYGYEGRKQKCTFEHPAFTSWTEVKKAIGEQKYINGIEDSWKMEFFIGIHGAWFVNLGIKMGVEISNVPFK